MAAIGAVTCGRAVAAPGTGTVGYARCLTGGAMAAFIPPAYFAGISATRHIAGSNLATLLAPALSVALAVSMGYRATTRPLARPGATAGVPGDPAPVPAGPASTW
jgi:hypothetical protein